MKIISKRLIEKLDMADQLKTEVEIMTKIKHPNIIQFHTCFEDHKNIYVVMELAEEDTLGSLLQKVDKYDEMIAAGVNFLS